MPDQKRREECGDPVSTGEYPLMESSNPLDHDTLYTTEYKGYYIHSKHNRVRGREVHQCDMGPYTIYSHGSLKNMKRRIREEEAFLEEINQEPRL